VSQFIKCDKCGQEYEHRANYLHTELLRSGTCMIDVRVEIWYAGFQRDVCDDCVRGLREQLLAVGAALAGPPAGQP
jgi:hypothetical protein